MMLSMMFFLTLNDFVCLIIPRNELTEANILVLPVLLLYSISNKRRLMRLRLWLEM